MKWNKFRLKPTAEAEDIVSSMLMDLCMRNITEDEITDIDALAEEIMQTARDNIGMFRLEPAVQDTPEDDGI